MITIQLPAHISMEIVHEQRQTHIAVIKNCQPGINSLDFKGLVKEILNANGIHQSPISTSNHGCSFTIKLLREESDRLLKSEWIFSVDRDHNLTVF